jgi:predicted DNA-binding transcriptional regulator AlpA
MSAENPKNEPLQEPLMVDAKKAARMCGIGRTLWLDLKNAGRVPTPIRLGGRVLWNTEELREWSRAGCPTQERWQQLRKDAEGQR